MMETRAFLLPLIVVLLAVVGAIIFSCVSRMVVCIMCCRMCLKKENDTQRLYKRSHSSPSTPSYTMGSTISNLSGLTELDLEKGTTEPSAPPAPSDEVRIVYPRMKLDPNIPLAAISTRPVLKMSSEDLLQTYPTRKNPLKNLHSPGPRLTTPKCYRDHRKRSRLSRTPEDDEYSSRDPIGSVDGITCSDRSNEFNSSSLSFM